MPLWIRVEREKGDRFIYPFAHLLYLSLEDFSRITRDVPRVRGQKKYRMGYLRCSEAEALDGNYFRENRLVLGSNYCWAQTLKGAKDRARRELAAIYGLPSSLTALKNAKNKLKWSCGELSGWVATGESGKVYRIMGPEDEGLSCSCLTVNELVCQYEHMEEHFLRLKREVE